jgi:alpha-N-arabinofuranosidase
MPIPTRRTFLAQSAGVAASTAIAMNLPPDAARAQAAAATEPGAIVIDPAPTHELSPFLYMQFMEPLGATDASVEAAWDYERDDWRKDFVSLMTTLAPGMLRYGGLLSRHYKWREGVGEPAKRPASRSYFWGGKDTNRVGTHEFVDLARRTGAEPLYCVNFAADGRLNLAHTKEGDRTADEREAAEWVAYCNDPDHAERKSHGHAEPYNVKYWQLGNETNYGAGGFTKEQAIARTISFAKAMRERDKSIKLLAWGDISSIPGQRPEPWAADMAKQAGEHLDFIAFHMMNQRPVRRDTLLDSLRYQQDPRAAWDELTELFHERVEKKLQTIEQSLDSVGSKHPIAITEGHLSLQPRNANPILTEWLTGVYHARCMNLYQRHGARLKIATLADYCGNRWTVNALMLQTPGDRCWLHPAGAIARLFKRHIGTHAATVKSNPPALDVTASRSGDDKLFLHVANTDYASAQSATFTVLGHVVTSATIFAIAADEPRQAINETNADVFDPKEHSAEQKEGVLTWRFPARSVSAVELTVRSV